jgi:hypothetical protein
MKRILITIVLVLVASTFALGQMKSKNANQNSKVEEALIKLDKEWTAAELRGDKEAVSRIVADDYMETLPDGRVQNKTQYLADIKATTDKDVADDYKVRVFGNLAIMTHRGTATGETNRQYRSTHVWMKRDGRWQLIAHHSSDITPTPTK